ncbi:MAG: polysaccharide deacetylase family protein [Gemmatimonadetes bacterium]|nr:polysaccharide deacetylase family protein [Gemmatimonadota bacterium]
MPDRRPIASLSLDLDNLWSYMKTHGDSGWESRPSYLDTVVPVALDLLAQRDYRITFFVVGVDAERTENAAALQSIVRAGHEVGNHSHEHEPWLSRYAPDQLEAEVARAEEAIEGVIGRRPTAFRGPGYSWSPTLLEVLARRGYQFDASTLPTWLGPLARRYYFATARLTPEEKAERSALFGTWSAGTWPNTPYAWALDGGRSLLEIPVTVMPGTRTPFHPSYLLYLARYSEALALGYWRAALTACRLARVEPSILLHPLDVVSADVAPEVAFFPGMDVPTATKHRVLQRAFAMLDEHFDVVPMSAHAAALTDRGRLPVRLAAPTLATGRS